MLALLSALFTFLVLTGLTPIIPTHEVVVSVLLANATMVAVLIGIVAWGFFDLIRARRKGRAGARLHVRIALMFGIVAAVPAILVAIIASITLERGLDRWFSTRTRAIVGSAVGVAQTYVREHASEFAPILPPWRTICRGCAACMTKTARGFAKFSAPRLRSAAFRSR